MRSSSTASSSFFLLALVAPVLFAACGVGASQSTPGHSVGEYDPDGGIHSDPDGGCATNTDPGPECTGCNGEPVSPVCQDGQWQCPLFGCPVELDGGSCNDEPEPACTDCFGNPVAPSCEEGQWLCPVYGCPIEVDASGCGLAPPPCPAPPQGCTVSAECYDGQWSCGTMCLDAGPDVVLPPPYDAGPPPPPPFACGTVGCDPTWSYCQITTGGPRARGRCGGSSFQCIPFPTTCSYGQPITCDCIQKAQGIGCGCVAAGGEVTVTCEIP